MIQIARAATAAALLLTLSGCVTSQPITIPVVDLAKPTAAPDILRTDVTATDCPDPGHMYGSFNDAIEMAVAQVPGADALINVQFEQKDTVGHYCMKVTGDAVAL